MAKPRQTVSSQHQQTAPWLIMLGYAVMIGGAIALFMVILNHGKELVPAGSVAAHMGSPAAAAAHKTNVLYHVLLSLVLILLLGRWLGKLFVHFHQPRVIGEMVAGIFLGPSLLGRIWPDAMHFILPDDARPFLGIIAQIGV